MMKIFLHFVVFVLYIHNCISEVAPKRKLYFWEDFFFELKKRSALQEATILVPVQDTSNVLYTNPSFECPTNFALSTNGDCMRQVETNVIASCQSDATLNKGQCEYFERADIIKQCPLGYVMRGVQCIATNLVQKRMQCPDNYTVGETGCERQVIGRGVPICTSPIKSDNQIINVQLTETNKCVLQILEKKSDVCDQGFELYLDGTCVMITAPYYTCQDGFTYDSNTNTCVQQVEVSNMDPKLRPVIKQMNIAPVYTCFEGYTLDSSNNCVSDNRRITSQVCLIGKESKLNNDYCERTEIENAYMSCPNNTEANSDGFCTGVVLHDLISVCPENTYEYYLDDKMCIEEISKEPNVFCPNGFTLLPHGLSCQRTSLADNGLICPSGMTISSNKRTCVRTEKTSKIPVCPPGSSWTFDALKNKCKCYNDCNAVNSVSGDTQIGPNSIPNNNTINPNTNDQNSNQTDPGNDIVFQRNLQMTTNKGYGAAAANDVDIVTVNLPSIGPRTIYYPQYVVHGTGTVAKQNIPAPTMCKKKHGCENVPPPQLVRTIRVITPVAPPSPVYNPTGYETTVVATNAF